MIDTRMQKPSPRTRCRSVTHRIDCKQPNREEGTPTRPIPGLANDHLRSRVRCRSVTHRIDCKQPNREEGTPTNTISYGDRECQTPPPAATAPLPGRPRHPFEKTGDSRPLSSLACTSVRSNNDPSAVPRGPSSRPSSALCYLPAAQTGYD
jgi:hypothetical protein